LNIQGEFQSRLAFLFLISQKGRLLLVMPKLAPIKRKDLIYYLRQLGFDGPISGGNHEYMQKERLKVRIPNPHKSDIGKNLLTDILKQANIERKIWEELQ